MKFHRLVSQMLLATAALTARAEGQTPLALVHGFSSGPGTWDAFRFAMTTNGNYTIPYPVTLSASSGVANEAGQLHSYFVTNSLGAGTIDVGHSQGGLVSRYASRTDTVRGIVTIGTPHLGAPVAGNFSTLTGYILEGAVASGAVDYLSDVVDNPYDPLYYDAVAAIDHAHIAWANVLVVLDVAADIIFFGDASLSDMTPGSSLLYSLNTSPGPTAERTGARQAIYGELGEGYGAGPARLVLSGPTSTALGNDLLIWSFVLENDGLNVLGDIPGDDPNYYWHDLAGWSLLDLSAQVYDIAPFWHYDMVGGVPNDAVVPYTSQAGMPNALSTLTLGPAHTEETTATAVILARLNAITGY